MDGSPSVDGGEEPGANHTGRLVSRSTMDLRHTYVATLPPVEPGDPGPNRPSGRYPMADVTGTIDSPATAFEAPLGPPWNQRRGPLISPAQALALSTSMTTWQAVDRRQVHKAAHAEVLVTDVELLAPDTYAVASQWPRLHACFQPRQDTSPSPLLFIETLRQAGIYITHRYLGVPLGYHFVFKSISASCLSTPPHPVRGHNRTVVLVIRVCASRGGTRFSGARLEIEAWSGAQHFATAIATYNCLSPAAYSRVRTPPAGARPPAERTTNPSYPDGHLDHQLRSDTHRSMLAVDVEDPTFFDHPVDHLPGMLLIDAALRAAGVNDPRRWDRLLGLDLSFQRFAELNTPTAVTARGARPHVEVEISQDGTVAASGVVTFAPEPAVRA
jgi:hypothetical protein